MNFGSSQISTEVQSEISADPQCVTGFWDYGGRILMAGEGTDSEKTENVPSDVVDILEASSEQELHAIIDYAQQLLRNRQEPTPTLEARPGEELVQVHDHDGYTVAIVRRTGEDTDSGPFAYLVRDEVEPATGNQAFHWHYLGRIIEE